MTSFGATSGSSGGAGAAAGLAVTAITEFGSRTEARWHAHSKAAAAKPEINHELTRNGTKRLDEQGVNLFPARSCVFVWVRGSLPGAVRAAAASCASARAES